MRPRRRHRAAAPATGGLATGAAAAAPRGRRAGPGRPCLPASSPGGTPAAKMSKVGRGSATPAAPDAPPGCRPPRTRTDRDRKSTRLNSSHSQISYAVFCLKKKKDPSDERADALHLRVAHASRRDGVGADEDAPRDRGLVPVVRVRFLVHNDPERTQTLIGD